MTNTIKQDVKWLVIHPSIYSYVFGFTSFSVWVHPKLALVLFHKGEQILRPLSKKRISALRGANSFL